MKEYSFDIVCKTNWHVFDTFLSLLKNGKPFDVLDNRERHILASLYVGWDAKKTTEELGITIGHYNVKLTSLRRKGMIDERNKPKYGLLEPSSVRFTLTRGEGMGTT